MSITMWWWSSSSYSLTHKPPSEKGEYNHHPRIQPFPTIVIISASKSFFHPPCEKNIIEEIPRERFRSKGPHSLQPKQLPLRSVVFFSQSPPSSSSSYSQEVESDSLQNNPMMLWGFEFQFSDLVSHLPSASNSHMEKIFQAGQGRGRSWSPISIVIL